MDWSAVIGAAGGAGSLIGDLAGVVSGFEQARGAASYANRRQRQAMQNRYRWAVHDLRQAGLNPMLAYTQGAGPMASMTGPRFEVPPPGAGLRAIAAAKDASFAAKAKDLAEVQVEAGRTAVEANVASAVQSSSQATLNKELEIVAQRDAALKTATAKKVDVERQLSESMLPSADAVKGFDETTLGGVLRVINRISESVQGSARGRAQH